MSSSDLDFSLFFGGTHLVPESGRKLCTIEETQKVKLVKVNHELRELDRDLLMSSILDKITMANLHVTMIVISMLVCL